MDKKSIKFEVQNTSEKTIAFNLSDVINKSIPKEFLVRKTDLNSFSSEVIISNMKIDSVSIMSIEKNIIESISCFICYELPITNKSNIIKLNSEYFFPQEWLNKYLCHIKFKKSGERSFKESEERSFNLMDNPELISFSFEMRPNSKVVVEIYEKKIKSMSSEENTKNENAEKINSEEKTSKNKHELALGTTEGIKNEMPLEKKDAINPSHYKQYPAQAIEMMEAIWGTEATATHCEMTAFKYRMRLGHKDNIDQEMKIEQWYLNKARELREKENKIKSIIN